MDKTQGNDPTATGAWIFQGNPAWYDISRAVTEQDLLVWGRQAVFPADCTGRPRLYLGVRPGGRRDRQGCDP